jgi:hypothetical protein
MHVTNGLPGVVTNVAEDPETRAGQPPLRGHPDPYLDHLTSQPLVLSNEVSHIRKVLAGDDQDMRWCLRCEVVERNNIRGFVDELRSQLTPGDLAENAIFIAIGHDLPISLMDA